MGKRYLRKGELVPVDYGRAELPDPNEVMKRPPPAIREGRAMDEWHWWRLWAIGQTAWVGQGGKRELRVAMDAQAKMREITMLRARFDGVRPTIEVSRQKRVGPYAERATEREKEILAYFKNNTYRKRDEETAITIDGKGDEGDGDRGGGSNGGGAAGIDMGSGGDGVNTGGATKIRG